MDKGYMNYIKQNGLLVVLVSSLTTGHIGCSTHRDGINIIVDSNQPIQKLSKKNVSETFLEYLDIYKGLFAQNTIYKKYGADLLKVEKDVDSGTLSVTYGCEIDNGTLKMAKNKPLELELKRGEENGFLGSLQRRLFIGDENLDGKADYYRVNSGKRIEIKDLGKPEKNIIQARYECGIGELTEFLLKKAEESLGTSRI